MATKNPRRNISRIETVSPSGKTYGGWEVRMQRRGEKTEKFFSDNGFGGKNKSLRVAKEFRDSLESKLRKYTVEELSANPSVRNQSGVVGVRLHQQKDVRGDYEYHYWYWVAQWTDKNGKRRTKSFSVHQHGDKEAYRLAVSARKKGVQEASR